MQALLTINSAEAYYSDCVHGSPSTASPRWVTDVKATRLAAGEAGGGVHMTTESWYLSYRSPTVNRQ